MNLHFDTDTEDNCQIPPKPLNKIESFFASLLFIFGYPIIAIILYYLL